VGILVYLGARLHAIIVTTMRPYEFWIDNKVELDEYVIRKETKVHSINILCDEISKAGYVLELVHIGHRGENDRSLSEEDETPFLYCGEYLDLETNTYYLRARSYRPATGRLTSEDSVRSTSHKMPNSQEVVDPLSLNQYTYCHNNPVRYADSTGHVPFPIITAAIGAIGGALYGAINSAMKGKFSWKEVGKDALIGAAIGFTGGVGVSLLATGSAFASTSTVMAGLGFGGATLMGTAGSTGFEQARQLVERSGYLPEQQIVSTVVPQATQALQNTSQILQNGTLQNQITVTEELIRNTMKDVPLQTQQTSVSLPVVQNYVDRILQGEINIPSIKVDGNIIVDGNHRYIASQIAGIGIKTQQWAGARVDKVIAWGKVFIDSVDWGNR